LEPECFYQESKTIERQISLLPPEKIKEKQENIKTIEEEKTFLNGVNPLLPLESKKTQKIKK